MKIKFKAVASEGAITGMLLIGGPLLMLGSGGLTNVDCKVDANQQVYVEGEKSPLYIGMVIVGGLQTAAGVMRLSGKKLGQEARPMRSAAPLDELATTEAVATLHEVASQPVDLVRAQSVAIQEPVIDLGEARRITSEEALPDWNPASTPVQAQKRTETSTQIIRTLAASNLSVVFSAPPGCGKSTTELAWLFNVFQAFPEAIVLIVGWKNDEFLGLCRIDGLVAVLDGVDFMPLMERVNFVFEILRQRRNTPQSERHKFVGKPVWLVLADYFATVQALSKNPRLKAVWDDFRTKLGIIITVGREFWCGAGIDTQSINVNQLGLVDASVRDCLNCNALGKINRNEFGKEEGGYDAILQAIGNDLIIKDPAIKASLLEELARLQPESDRTGRPIMLTTMGNPRVMLLDDLRAIAAQTLPEETLERLATRLRRELLPAHSVPQPEAVTATLELGDDIPTVLEPPTDQEIETINAVLEAPITGSGSEVTNPSESAVTDAELTPADLAKVTPELHAAVTYMLGLKVAPSSIIKNQWGYKGRNYMKGKKLYNLLMERFGGDQLGENDEEN